MLGHPGETVSDYRETLNFALEINPTYASFHPLVAFPGSPLYEKQFGKGPYWDEPLVLSRTYRTIGQEMAVAQFVRKSYLRFYLRPWIWPRLMHDQLFNCFRGFRLFWNYCRSTMSS